MTITTELQQQLTLASLQEQKKYILFTYIRQQLVEFFNLSSVNDIKPEQNLIEIITDSLKAVDFKILLETSLNSKLRSTLLFEYPRLDLLVDYLVDEVLTTINNDNSVSTESNVIDWIEGEV
ncbi:MAG: acyl carrier protein [Gloeotrichia echinulata HAB0833]